MPMIARHSQVVTLRSTEHLSHESAACHRTDQISSSHQCKSAVRGHVRLCKTWSEWRGLGDTSLGSQEQYACSAGKRGELEAYSDADWSGDRTTRQSVSAGVIMRDGHCLKVWTKKQQAVSLSTAESELHAAVKTASEAIGIRSLAKVICG